MAIAFSEEQRNEWKRKIEKQQESGQSIQKWCNENRISAHVFHYWKKQLFAQPLTQNSFKELVDQKRCSIDINYQQVHVHIESESLKQLLEVIKELSC